MLLKDYWCLAGCSEEGGRQLLRLGGFNELVVLYGTEDGNAVATKDRWNHRKLPLVLGNLIGNSVHWCYHGFFSMRVANGNPCSADERSLVDFSIIEQDGWVAARELLHINTQYLSVVHWRLDLFDLSFFVHVRTIRTPEITCTDGRAIRDDDGAKLTQWMRDVLHLRFSDRLVDGGSISLDGRYRPQLLRTYYLDGGRRRYSYRKGS